MFCARAGSLRNCYCTTRVGEPYLLPAHTRESCRVAKRRGSCESPSPFLAVPGPEKRLADAPSPRASDCNMPPRLLYLFHDGSPHVLSNLKANSHAIWTPSFNCVLVSRLDRAPTVCGERVPDVSRRSGGVAEPDMQDGFRPEAGGIEARSGEIFVPRDSHRTPESLSRRDEHDCGATWIMGLSGTAWKRDSVPAFAIYRVNTPLSGNVCEFLS